jgi:hypothetical protein
MAEICMFWGMGHGAFRLLTVNMRYSELDRIFLAILWYMS